jgi:hypothetical protein
MGGGLLQLVAYGAQDAYISGNPQITFWKGLFKRHTNFAMEPFRINFNGQPTWDTKQTAVIGRHADLLYSTYVEVQLPTNDQAGQAFQWNNDMNRLGYNLINYAELDIGGQVIDRLYGEFLYLWDTLTFNVDKSYIAQQMVSGGLGAPGASQFNTPVGCNTATGRPALPNTLYIPLCFFFTRNPGAALPLISLQYHEVKINVYWNDIKSIAGNFTNTRGAPVGPTSAALYIDYIYLDTEERRRMAQASHEYLIEQCQFNEDKGISSVSNRIDLTFNHPVKELIWVVQPSFYRNCNLAAQAQFNTTRLQPFRYDGLDRTNTTPAPPVFEQHIQINGQDRLDRRYGDYYNKVQAFQHHSGSNYVNAGINGLAAQTGIYSYSFALRPEEHQPSGTCNFSRIDTATIVMSMNGAVYINQDTDQTYDVRVYAINYNVLRVMSGMGGLAYSN